jgi:hypothetical protein
LALRGELEAPALARFEHLSMRLGRRRFFSYIALFPDRGLRASAMARMWCSRAVKSVLAQTRRVSG